MGRTKSDRRGERLCAAEDPSGSFHAHGLIMENTRRNVNNAAFQLKVIKTAAKEGNRATACRLDINESMVLHWWRKQKELSQTRRH